MTYFFWRRSPKERFRRALIKEIKTMTQAMTDLTAAVAALTAAVPTIVAALGSQGTPDTELAPLTAAVTDAVSQLQAALPPTP